MEKRSSFERRPQDTYPTPAAALEPLLPYLRPETHFIEPCAGDGYLVGHLKRAGHVLVGAYGLPHDARMKSYPEAEDDGVVFVTNPPWARSAPQRSTTSKRVKRPSANACGGCCAAPAK